MKTIIENKKIDFLYYKLDTVETGISLLGPEVKSLRLGKCSLNGAYISIIGGECFLKNCEIALYDKAGEKLDPKRERKLLLHKSEILKLDQKVKEKGLTLIPSKIYFKNQKVKVEVCLCRGKNTVDKKQTIKERDLKREMEKEFKSVNKNR